MTGGRFTVLGAGEDVFGIWSSPVQQGVAFAAGALAETPETPTWHAQLPASLDEAQRALDVQHARLAATQERLDEAQRQLNQVSRTGVSFGPSLTAPEAALMTDLAAAQSPRFAPATDEQRETRSQFERFVARVRLLVTHYACIKTEVGNTPVGYTLVGWDGDFETRWLLGTTPDTATLHRQTVHLALTSRADVVRLLGVIVTGAANLAARLSLPGGQIAALPAAWKFFRDVLKELH
jgi:hypothetical protein